MLLQVAQIFAMHCNVCHGDSGGLSTRTYEDLMRGGNLGAVVIPGDPDRSLLIHFLDGRRGEAHRMPLGGRPLAPDQIDIIRRWIEEGAKPDATGPPPKILTLAKIPAKPGQHLRIRYRVDTESYLTLTARDPKTRRVLLTEVASLNTPGELLTWEITVAKGWPKSLRVELEIAYPKTEPYRTELYLEGSL